MQPELFYVGIKVIFVRDDQVLLLKRTDPDGRRFLDIPGGRIQEGASIEDTIAREISEELPGVKGWKIEKLAYACRLLNVTPDGNPLVLIVYRGTIMDESINLSDEHDDYLWFPIKDVPAYSGKEVEGYRLGTQLQEAIKNL